MQNRSITFYIKLSTSGCKLKAQMNIYFKNKCYFLE